MREARNFLAAMLGVACALVVLFTVGGVFNSTTNITNNPTEAFAGQGLAPSSISNTGTPIEYQTVLTIVALSAVALLLALAVTFVASRVNRQDDLEHAQE